MKIHDYIWHAPVGARFGLTEVRQAGVTASNANLVLNKMASRPKHLRQIEKIQRGGPGKRAMFMKVK